MGEDLEQIEKALKMLRSLKQRLEKNAPAVDILKELPLIRKEISTIHNQVLTQYLEDCLKDCFDAKSIKKANRSIDELIEAFKKLR